MAVPPGHGRLTAADIPGGTTANGTRAQLWTCNGQTNQRWTLPS